MDWQEKADKLLTKLSGFFNPGSGEMEEYFWRHPQDYIDLHRFLSYDASEDGDNEYYNQLLKTTFPQVFAVNTSKTKRRLWCGLRLDHIEAKHRLLVICGLCFMRKPTPDIFNFLTLADVENSKFGLRRYEDRLSDIYNVDKKMSLSEFGTQAQKYFEIEEPIKNLASAFRDKMIAEARPHQKQVVLGSYQMERIPLNTIDNLFDYDYLRMTFNPTGIFVSIVKENRFSAHWWSPKSHSFWLLGSREAWAMDALMACIWRDACVVKHQFYHKQGQRNYGPASKKKEFSHKGKLILPRTVTHVLWSSDEERERVIRSTHAVREHYRQLADWQYAASDEARHNAIEFGYPEPPEGFTFVKPHSRGGEANQKIRPVICKGLQVAKIALG